jgi:tetratricopeptide (TPR) repeat protein
VVALLERARKGPQAPHAQPAGAADAPGREERPSASASVAAEAVDEAVRLFAAGEVDDALAKAEGAGQSREAQVLAVKIHKFRQVYDEAQAEHKAKRADSAIRLREQAKALEEKITGPLASSVGGSIRRRLADMYYVRGIDASLEERYGDALQAFRTALGNDPSHGPTRKKIDELASRASELLEEAETLRRTDPDRAKSRYRLVLQMLPATDERYRKAKQRLDAMP